MIRQFLSEEYLSLARGFLELGEPLEALECAYAAVRLEPGCREARELMKQVADHDPERTSPGTASEEVARLRRRKKRLHACQESDPGLARLAGQAHVADHKEDRPVSGEATGDGLQEDTSAELGRRFARLQGRLEAERADKAQELLARVERLAQRLGAERRPEPPEDEEADGPWGELSIEHEFHNLGNDYYKIGRFGEAIECYHIALEIRPDLLETYFNRGLAYTRQQKYDKAWEDLTKVVELNPHLSEAYYTRGLVEEYRQRYDAAIADYEKALEVDPGYTKAETQMAIARGKKASVEDSSSSAGTTGRAEEDQIGSFARYIQKPDGGFDRAGGCRRAKRELRAVAAFLNGSEAFAQWGCSPSRGVLLYGPPGTGKTLLARALAAEVRCPFYCTPSTIFLNQYYGNTEKNIRTLWDEASSHPEGAVIFIDEAEALLTLRSDLHSPRGDDCHNKAVACLLERMDGLAKRPSRLVVLAATNRFGNIDPAFLRPGRFSYHIEVGRPDAFELAEIWLIHLELAEGRSKRLDVLSRELREAVRAARGAWLDDAFRPGGLDASGIVHLARIGEREAMVGAGVEEVVRRCVQERAMAAHEWGIDLGPITSRDLLRHLEAYLDDRGQRPDRWDGRSSPLESGFRP